METSAVAVFRIGNMLVWILVDIPTPNSAFKSKGGVVYPFPFEDAFPSSCNLGGY